ncbi:MAG: 3-phosphoshikimate 1-carboxyvinyltransferase [Lachnospiraceae bacterium]|nr:3-phosphoshikimate 1-carboxyvinyltransferase [Lachnospiraceae bacterium]
MSKIIKKGRARGTINPPPSKSLAHRYLICAAFSNGESVIDNIELNEDVSATLDCIKALGGEAKWEKGKVFVKGIKEIPQDEVVFKCRESGSTIRFFMGICLCLGIKGRFYGAQRLMERPYVIYEELCQKEGIPFIKNKDCIEIKGKLKNLDIQVAGNISSQFITGLLLGIEAAGGGHSIEIIPPFESRSYINLTVYALETFGVKCEWQGDNKLKVPGGIRFTPKDVTVEADCSNAAFFDAFNVLGGDVKITGINPKSLQGDRVYYELFRKLSKEKAFIDISDCPDLGPILFGVAAALKGGVFKGTDRLEIKESKRGTVMCEELAKFGVVTHQGEDTIEIEGGLLGEPKETLCGHNDHRIVMTMAVLLTLTGGKISEDKAVNKSFPGFFERLGELGIEVTDDGMD